MHKKIGLNAVAFVLLLTSSTASWAQAAQTWVSGVGLDTSPCSRLLPCKTFAGAIAKTAAGGEINTLDPADFGPVTITKSINIISEGSLAGVLGTGTAGIVVAAGPNDVVLLRGLDIAGSGTGTVGVSVTTAAAVEIQNCQIYGFTNAGVLLSSNQASRVHILNSEVFANNYGVSVQGGLNLNGMVIESTSVDHNTTANVTLSGASALLLNNSSLLGAPAGITLTTGSPSLQSFGNNRITGTAPTLSPVALR